MLSNSVWTGPHEVEVPGLWLHLLPLSPWAHCRVLPEGTALPGLGCSSPPRLAHSLTSFKSALRSPFEAFPRHHPEECDLPALLPCTHLLISDFLCPALITFWFTTTFTYYIYCLFPPPSAWKCKLPKVRIFVVFMQVSRCSVSMWGMRALTIGLDAVLTCSVNVHLSSLSLELSRW